MSEPRATDPFGDPGSRPGRLPPQPADTPSTIGPPPATPSSGWVGTTGPTGDGTIPPPPPTPRGGPRLVIRIALIGAFVVLVGLLAMIFLGASLDPYERAASDAGKRLLAMPEFKARFGDVTSEERAYEIGQQLVTTALIRLEDADLDRYWDVTKKLLGATDADSCGKILRQTISRAEATKVARSLDLDSFKVILDVTVTAMQAELRRVPAKPEPTEDVLNAAFTDMRNEMGEARFAAAANTMSDTAASNPQVCAAGREFLDGVLDLDDEPRLVILRYMVAP